MNGTCPLGWECPGRWTCPECGTSMGCPGGEDRLRAARLSIVVIRRPQGWEPASLLDAPPAGVVLEIVEETPIHDPATYVRHYNAASIDDGGSRWAALTGVGASVGDPVGLLKP